MADSGHISAVLLVFFSSLCHPDTPRHPGHFYSPIVAWQGRDWIRQARISFFWCYNAMTFGNGVSQDFFFSGLKYLLFSGILDQCRCKQTEAFIDGCATISFLLYYMFAVFLLNQEIKTRCGCRSDPPDAKPSTGGSSRGLITSCFYFIVRPAAQCTPHVQCFRQFIALCEPSRLLWQPEGWGPPL